MMIKVGFYVGLMILLNVSPRGLHFMRDTRLLIFCGFWEWMITDFDLVIGSSMFQVPCHVLAPY